jgi:aspartate aminotransferase
MPTISERGKNVSPSPIRKLIKYADKAKENGTKVYHLNIGQPDILTPKIALDVLQNADLQIVAYTPSNGTASYRNALPRYYQKYNLQVEADEIIVTSGASEGIFLTFLAAMNEGDEVRTFLRQLQWFCGNGFAKNQADYMSYRRWICFADDF